VGKRKPAIAGIGENLAYQKKFGCLEKFHQITIFNWQTFEWLLELWGFTWFAGESKYPLGRIWRTYEQKIIRIEIYQDGKCHIYLLMSLHYINRAGRLPEGAIDCFEYIEPALKLVGDIYKTIGAYDHWEWNQISLKKMHA